MKNKHCQLFRNFPRNGIKNIRMLLKAGKQLGRTDDVYEISRKNQEADLYNKSDRGF